MQPSGELMREAPGPGFVGAQLAGALQGLSSFGRQIERGINKAGGYEPGLAETGRYVPGGQQEKIKPVAEPTPVVAPPGPLSDDVDVRASEARRMLQQATPYWEREENKGLLQAAQVGGGPRADKAGYAQRADIAAWIEANKNAPKGVDGKNIVDRFLEKQQRQGLLDAPEQAPGLGGTRIAMPVDADSAAQAGRRGLVGFEGNALEQAQANVSELQGRERAGMSQKIWQAAAEGTLPNVVGSAFDGKTPDWAQSAQAVANPAVFGEMAIAQPFSNPEFNRQYAGLAQPTGAQSVATREEPQDPADALARRHLQRAALLGN
jgi:hypothetical protein